MRLKAPAKVNLCLHILGRTGCGLHVLESLIAFADIGDEIEVLNTTKAPLLKISGPFATQAGAPENNLVLRVLDALEQENKFTIRIVKNIPGAAGLGGGSADAAAVVRTLVRMRDIVPDMLALARLGADIPVCFVGKPCWIEGVGERITPLSVFPKVPVVLVHPGVPCPTGPVFATWRGPIDVSVPVPSHGFESVKSLLHFLSQTHNALEIPACGLIKEVEAVLYALRKEGALHASMSGSGSACCGIFRDAHTAQYAANRIVKKNPQWWVRPGHLMAA